MIRSSLQCPMCGHADAIVSVQYRGTPEDYDGVSEWNCQKCGTRWGRWSGRILGAGEIERRYGRAE
jgi:transposase-like protein